MAAEFFTPNMAMDVIIMLVGLIVSTAVGAISWWIKRAVDSITSIKTTLQGIAITLTETTGSLKQHEQWQNMHSQNDDDKFNSIIGLLERIENTQERHLDHHASTLNGTDN